MFHVPDILFVKWVYLDDGILCRTNPSQFNVKLYQFLKEFDVEKK